MIRKHKDPNNNGKPRTKIIPLNVATPYFEPQDGYESIENDQEIECNHVSIETKNCNIPNNKGNVNDSKTSHDHNEVAQDTLPGPTVPLVEVIVNKSQKPSNTDKFEKIPPVRKVIPLDEMPEKEGLEFNEYENKNEQDSLDEWVYIPTYEEAVSQTQQEQEQNDNNKEDTIRSRLNSTYANILKN